MAHFLKERGLELSHEKTGITHVEEGFDFLGQNVRRYRNGKILTKPSASSVKTFLSKIQDTIDDSGGLTAGELIQRLNQQIKGSTMYHRYAASKRTFGHMDHRIFQMVWRWCRRRHPRKSGKWIRRRYCPRDEYRHWVFTGVLRGQKGPGLADPVDGRGEGEDHSLREIRSEVNPYDPKWELYLEARLGWQLAQTRDRPQSDRIPMEGTKGTMSDLRSTPAHRRGRLPDPPSDLAEPRRYGHGGQHGVDACQLPPAGPRAGTTDGSGRVPRGAFVNA